MRCKGNCLILCITEWRKMDAGMQESIHIFTVGKGYKQRAKYAASADSFMIFKIVLFCSVGLWSQISGCEILSVTQAL